MGQRLFKRGDVWHALVRSRSGKWKRVSTHCTDKTAAQRALKLLEQEAIDPAYAAANKAQTADLLSDYIASRIRVGRAEGTVSFNRKKAGHMVRLMPKYAHLITHAVLVGYIEQRLRETAQRSTIKKELGVLRAALKLARRNGLYQYDWSVIGPEIESDYKPHTRALSEKEARDLLALLQARNKGYAAIVAFILMTGARWGEAMRAEQGDLRLTGTVIRGTKTKAAARIVPATAHTEWLRPIAGQGSGRGNLKFPRWTNARRDLGLACLALKIAPVTANDLRRTYATWLRNRGVEPSLIASALGHTTSRMVEMVYGRLGTEALGTLLNERIGQSMQASENTVQHVSKDPCETGWFGGVNENQKQSILSVKIVPRDRIELSTRGFSGKRKQASIAGFFADVEGDCAIGVQRQRPPRWVKEATDILVRLRLSLLGGLS